MHGDIHVESVVNEGSTFIFTIRVKNGNTVAEPESGYDSRCSTIDELRVQLGQPRILVIGFERIKLMIQSFIPWIQHLEHRATVEEGLGLLLTSAIAGTPYDCIVMDSPPPDVLMTIIHSIENTPSLGQTRILLLLAPIVDNIRRHFSHSTVTAHGDAEGHLIEPNDHLQHHHVFHHLVTRLSKPMRTIKLLNALVNVMSKPSSTIKLIDQTAHSPTDSDTTEKVLLQLGPSEESVKPSPSDKTILVTPPYSRKNHETFSPEELALFKGQRILVAEDNIIAQRLIVKQLERLGFIVEKCNNGFECFNTWEARGPGYFMLAWIDHHMPKCDGLEATRMIRQREKEMKHSPALPIIALTGKILDDG
jgi:CheY-like chemotaxis protein